MQSEYKRFQLEILDSQIFDRLKTQIGVKHFIALVNEKIKVIPFDLVSSLANF